MNDEALNNQQSGIATGLTSIADRQLSAASLEFKNALEGISNAQQNALDAYSSRQQEATNAGLDTFTGAAANIGLSLANEAVKFVGNALTAIPTALNEFGVNRGDFTKEDLFTYRSILDKQRKEKLGETVTYTDEERNFMQPWEKELPEMQESAYAQYAKQLMTERGMETKTPKVNMESRKEMLDRFFEANKNIEGVNEFFKPIEPYVNQSKKETAISEVEAAYEGNVGQVLDGLDKISNDDLSGIQEAIKGIAGMSAETAYAVLSNPQALLQMTAESIPAMVAAARKLPIALAAGANKSFQDTLTAFEEEYGDIPVGDERKKAQAMATLAGIVAVQSDRFLAQGAKLIPTPVKKVTPSVVTHGVAEGIAEVTEDALVQYGGVQDVEKLDGKALYASGVFGAAMGSGIAGVPAAMAKAKELGTKVVTDVKAKAVANTVIAEGTIQNNNEINTSDIEINEDVKKQVIEKSDLSTSAGLAKALRSASTIISDEKASTDPKEDAALLAKHSLNMVENRIDNAREMLAQIDMMLAEPEQTEASINQLNATKKEVSLELGRLEKVFNTNSQSVQNNFDSLIGTPEKVNAIKERLVNPNTELASMADDTEGFTTKRANKDASLLITASTEGDLVSSEDLTAAAKHPEITPQKAIQLTKTAELNDVIKNTAEVSNDIINGGNGYVGVRQYQKRIGDMLNLGSVRAAGKELGKLNNFSAHMTQKAADVAQAFAEVQTQPFGSEITLDQYVNPVTRKPLTVHHNSKGLVDTIQNEAGLVNTAFTNLKEQVTAYSKPAATTTAEAQPKTEESVEPVQEQETTQEVDSTTVSETTAETSTVTEGATDTTTTTEESTVAVEEPVNTIVSSLNTGVATEGVSFFKNNPVVTYLRKGKRGSLFSIGLKQEAIAEHLGRDLRPSEAALVQVLPKFIKPFSATFTAITDAINTPEQRANPKRRKYQARNALEAFTQEDGTYSEEFKNTLAISAFEFLEGNVSSMVEGSHTSMARILNLDTKDFVPTHAQMQALSEVGSPYTSVASRIGRVVMKNLGLAKNPDMAQNVQNNIEFALGKAVIGTLVQAGIAKVQAYPISQLASLGGNYSVSNDVEGDALVEVYSVSLDPKALDRVLGFSSEKDSVSVDLFNYTDGFIEGLTSHTREQRKAVIGDKAPRVSNKVKSSGGQIAPAEFVKGANKDAAVPHVINANMHKAFLALGSDWFGTMLGKRDDKSVIAALVPKVIGKNRTIDRDIANYEAFVQRMVEETGDTASQFFYPFEFGKNFRMFAKSADINYQTSKLHRYLTSVKPSLVNPTDVTDKGFTIFKLAVAQGLGVGIDKQTLAKNLHDFEEIMQNPVFTKGVDVLVKVNNGAAITDEDKAALMDAVNEGGENTHSLKSLMSLAEYKMANGQPFETTATYEIDGITNGPFNAHIQMGLQTLEGVITQQSVTRMAQGGLFLDGTSTYADWISNPSNWDMYQTTASSVNTQEKLYVAALNEDPVKNRNAIIKYNTLKKYVGDIVEVKDGEELITKKGRNLAKNPVTVTVYASGARAISDKAARDIRNNIVNELQKALDANDMEAMNTIGQDLITLGFSLNSDVKSFTYDKQEVNAFDNYVNNTLGKMLNTAIRSEFATQKTNTDIITEASNIVFDMFNLMYTKKVDEKLAELRASGELTKYEYLSDNQLADVKKSLAKAMPIFNGYYGDVNNGIMTGGFSNNAAVRDEYKPMFRVDAAIGHKGGQFSYTTGFTAPDAAPMAMLNIANGDATTMARAAMKAKHDIGLNVFDARIARVADVVYSSEILNTAAYEAVAKHSITDSVADRVQEALVMFNEANIDLTAPETQLLRNKAYVAGDKDAFILNDKVFTYVDGVRIQIKDDTVNATVNADTVHRYLNKIAMDSRAMATASANARQILQKELTFNQFEAIGTGVKYNKGKKVEGVVLSKDMITEALTKAETMLVKAVSVMPEGDIDQALANAERKIQPTTNNGFVSPEAEQAVADFFAESVSVKVSELGGLVSTLSLKPATEMLFNNLIDTLSNRGITVEVNTGTKQDEIVTSSGTVSSDDVRGYYDSVNRKIVLNGADKVNTGMTAETVMHELVHAAVNESLFAYKSGDTKSLTKKQLDAAKRVDRLYEQAKKEGEFPTEALENIYEFAAWGITNTQAKTTLAKTKAKARKLISSLVQTIRDLIGLEPSVNNAYLELMDSVVILAQGVKTKAAIESNAPTTPQRVHDDIRALRLSEVFEGLSVGDTVLMSETHRSHLRDVLDAAVAKVIDPTLLRTRDANETLSTEDALLIERLDPSIRTNLNMLSNKGFRMSRQEAFVFGMYNHVIHSALNDFGWNTREIRRMFDHAAKSMTWEDFVVDSSVLDTEQDRAASKALAQERYDAVFKVEAKAGYDYLSNFMALAETNEAFRERLEQLSTPTLKETSIKGATVRETISNIVNAILNWLNDFAVTRSHEPNVLAKLDKLAKNIRHKERLEKSKLASVAISTTGFMSNTLNRINNLTKARIDAVLDGTQAKFRNRTYLNAAINLSGLVLSKRRAENLALGLDVIQNMASRGRENFVSALWSEMKGSNTNNRKIHNLLAIKNKMIDQENVHTQRSVARMVRESFDRELTEKESNALTKAILKTDAVSLIDNGYTYDEVQRLIGDIQLVKNEIAKVRAQLRQQVSPELYNYFNNRSVALGKYMATGKVIQEGMVFNTDAVVTLFGTGKADPKVSAKVRTQVDSLISLQAMQYTPLYHRKRVAKLMGTEAARTDGNGVNFIMSLHRQQKVASLKKNFAGVEHNYQKGYVREIVDPNVSIQVAPLSAAQELELQGYSMVTGKALPRDAHDQLKEPMYMFVSESAGQVTYLQSILSIANKTAKGFSIVDSFAQSGNSLTKARVPELMSILQSAKKANVERLFTAQPSVALNPLVPTFNKAGVAVDYRYMMSEEQKDMLLKKDNRVDEVLGGMYAGISLKVNSIEVNEKLIDALHEQYVVDADKGNLGRYVFVEPNSKDRVLRDTWNLMPEEAKKHAQKVFGKEGVYVRNDLLNVAFGYRKWSIADLWNPNSEYPKLIKDLAMKAVEGVYGKKVAHYLVKGERGLQELVRDLKDIVVIKSVVVMVGNIVSNTVQLPILHGVSPVAAIRDQITAFAAANDYRNNAKEIFELQTRIDAGLGNKGMEIRLNKLTQDQLRSPVKDLMDAGMLQTIIDDAGGEDNIYTMKHELFGKLDNLVSKIPAPVLEGFKQVTLQQGSVGYDFLSQTTQLSDFAARYALYNHLKKQGINTEEALAEITDAFINYDLPPHKAMQYMNDIGITWFFKYFIRVQKVIMKGLLERPAQVLGFAVMQNMLGVSVDNPTNSFAPFVDIGNKTGLVDGIGMAANAHILARLY